MLAENRPSLIEIIYLLREEWEHLAPLLGIPLPHYPQKCCNNF